ncbi:hypothetical protein FB451DRAFT_1493409 [Mycena latifolia]|nr:hypothetical protein FB451DRAFT_1493409 [Mycena latifolia]
MVRPRANAACVAGCAPVCRPGQWPPAAFRRQGGFAMMLEKPGARLACTTSPRNPHAIMCGRAPSVWCSSSGASSRASIPARAADGGAGLRSVQGVAHDDAAVVEGEVHRSGNSCLMKDARTMRAAHPHVSGVGGTKCESVEMRDSQMTQAMWTADQRAARAVPDSTAGTRESALILEKAGPERVQSDGALRRNKRRLRGLARVGWYQEADE